MLKRTGYFFIVFLCCVEFMGCKSIETEQKYSYNVISETLKTARLIQMDIEDGKVVLPQTIDGYSVVEIGDGTPVLQDKQRLMMKSLVIPEGVVKISGNAFSKCSYTKEVVFPKSLRYIGNNAFLECTSLKNIHLYENILEIGDRAFEYCQSIHKVDIQSTKVSIGKHAFNTTYSGESNFTDINVPLKISGQWGEGCFEGYRGKTFLWKEFNGIESCQGILNGNMYVKNIVIPDMIKNVYIGMNSIGTYLPIKRLVIPEEVDKFEMEQQPKVVDALIVKGKDTKIMKDFTMGETSSNYICAKEIIGYQGSGAEKYAKDCFYPDIGTVRHEVSEIYFTEANTQMKPVKFTGVQSPNKPTVKYMDNQLVWKQDEAGIEYEVYYRYDKSKSFEKQALTRKPYIKWNKEGEVKVRGIIDKYGETWHGEWSNVLDIK